MKALLFILLFCCITCLLPANITGEWWCYNFATKDHDHLFIDDDFKFLLELTISEKFETFEGIINIIGGDRYYTQVIYNGVYKNCYIVGYIYKDSASGSDRLSITIYENEHDTLYYDTFRREKIIPPTIGETGEKISKNEFIFGFDTGILGVGVSYGTGNTFAFDFNANLANFYFENIATGLGIEFFPINYSYSINANEHILSFSKLYLYWNFDKILGLNIDSGNDDGTTLILGPFFSIQTLNLTNFENFNTNISYSAGIKFARKETMHLREENSRRFRRSVGSSNIELGYNYFNNRHSVYFTIGLSPVYTLIPPISYIVLAIFGIGD
jgi:hypothetical protein